VIDSPLHFSKVNGLFHWTVSVTSWLHKDDLSLKTCMLVGKVKAEIMSVTGLH